MYISNNIVSRAHVIASLVVSFPDWFVSVPSMCCLVPRSAILSRSQTRSQTGSSRSLRCAVLRDRVSQMQRVRVETAHAVGMNCQEDPKRSQASGSYKLAGGSKYSESSERSRT